MLTLQLSFVTHDRLTWRRRTAKQPTGRTSRWRRFQTARGSSALLSLVAFPFLAPATGTAAAYWALLAGGTVVNYCSDHLWSFSRKAGTSMTEPPHGPGYRG